jgi:hypothetical protein
MDLFLWLQFLDFAKTPYNVAASEPIDVPEVNPSASLNEWIIFPSRPGT